HLRRYRAPKEQRQIIRMVFAPCVFALVAFFEVLSYEIAPYIDPLGDLYEAFGLCALFLLYLQYAAPNGTFDDETFEAVKAAQEGKAVNFDFGRISWCFGEFSLGVKLPLQNDIADGSHAVFQYPVLELLSLIILEATQASGHYCVQSLSPRFGHLWVTVISSVGVGACVLAILRFYGRMTTRIKVRRGLAKLVCFKLIVALRFFQSLVFSILLDHDVIKTSSTFGYNDILYGLENSITCAEMVVLSLGFWYAYSSTEYGSHSKSLSPRVLMYKAVLDAINPWELIVGIFRIFTVITHLRVTGGFQDWNAHKEQVKADKRAQKMKGRYQTLDGMESLAHPGASHGRSGSSSQFEDTTPAVWHYSVGGHPIRQAPATSPPAYQDGDLMAESRPGQRTFANGGVWDGRCYERSRSPERLTEDAAARRDMV
ncbi:seven transmembrane receptor protein, partial [Pseudocercospora fijiensis CIRAD86]